MSTLRADVARDWSWSDGYLPEIRRILALNAAYFFDLQVASYQQDVKQATDMLVSISRSKAVAIRLRRSSYSQRDLTIRASRVSGATTELAKIKAGHGDFYLYGWTQDFTIPEWMLIDLHKLRATHLLNEPWPMIANRDNSTGFIAIPYTTLSLCGCVMNSRVYPR